jgi:hypothetical protein
VAIVNIIAVYILHLAAFLLKFVCMSCFIHADFVIGHYSVDFVGKQINKQNFILNFVLRLGLLHARVVTAVCAFCTERGASLNT